MKHKKNRIKTYDCVRVCLAGNITNTNTVKINRKKKPKHKLKILCNLRY